MMSKTREDAFELLKKYNKSDSLIGHGLCVEAVMRYFAKEASEDEETWGIVGLLHDLDYEMYPDEHCTKAKEILEKEGYSDDIIRAVMSHGYEICTDIEPMSQMEKTLYAVDELSGLVMACVYVRPSKSVMDLETSSVKKKWKQKSFAAGANREVIQKGADMLGLLRDDLISKVIMAMRSEAKALGIE
jgi:predicted hydrolase (HD superfamily)